MTGVKETACTTCIHREVCALKNDFLEACSAVSNMTYTRENGDRGDIIRLADVTFIKPINLGCKFYRQEATIRGNYESDTAISTVSTLHDYPSTYTTLRG